MDVLPVELVCEIALYGTSSSLPPISKRFHSIFKSAPPAFNASFISARITHERPKDVLFPSQFLTYALRYPICSTQVIDILLTHPPLNSANRIFPELPRRLFKPLKPCKSTTRRRLRPSEPESDPPIPYLNHLFSLPKVHPDINAFDGYALTRAVYAKAVPLIQLLLEHGAAPDKKDGIAVTTAIRSHSLPLVKMLIERHGGQAGANSNGRHKRRRLDDRIAVTQRMAKEAVRCDAADILEYLTHEKGCVLDMEVLHMMM